ncbi:hypothetical protein DIE14_00675 [Burkholderia sp. Bp9017]|uniref:Uncharacterized protein n=1 Tax=Burkholderia anthina TaxID=179879 RepID=A0A7T6VJ28_9BURK|nr:MULTISPECIES: hypothetical protein [Burkholderia]MBY4867763.1 hypothetical protein [Burkholderia anthina]QQK04883.1 hypothetical protein JFN94_26555 [Burkholderia anthina]RQZ31469.1 hypothetical protein DIE14_00675 [Burkholderia sp. Bp9017]RQZ37602.1 hypothetical protein DIE13_00665 [Burkholderia sp. Bp9016]
MAANPIETPVDALAQKCRAERQCADSIAALRAEAKNPERETGLFEKPRPDDAPRFRLRPGTMRPLLASLALGLAGGRRKPVIGVPWFPREAGKRRRGR